MNTRIMFLLVCFVIGLSVLSGCTKKDIIAPSIDIDGGTIIDSSTVVDGSIKSTDGFKPQ